jgi:hypothetical protein
MLPIGAIRKSKTGKTQFTPDEQITLLTLWSICRSPLIFGGNLPDTDPFTFSLITNPEVIAVDQRPTPGRQLFRHGDLIAWVADVPESPDKYLALFNAQDDSDAEISVDLADIGLHRHARVHDLWKHSDLGLFPERFAARIPPHGAGLFRLADN